MAKANRIITIGDVAIAPGERRNVCLPIAKMYTHVPLGMPVHVINGRRPGPRLFITAAIHGDELNGIEIIRRLMRAHLLDHLRGAVIAVPIVNVFGVLNHSRYLPDRRDLNRSFPGTDTGSLASRLADLLIREVVSQSTHGVDIHTGALHRSNLPHIRAKMDDPETERLARAFGVPLLLNSDLRDGSLRQATAERGVPTLLYESGEALRFDETGIRAGVGGILNVMRALNMLPSGHRSRHRLPTPLVASSSFWVRAANGGILRTHVRLGEMVDQGTRLASLSDPFGEEEQAVTSPYSGIIIGRSNLPLVNGGDAIFHIARFPRKMDTGRTLEAIEELPMLPPEEQFLYQEPEIR